MKTRYIEEGSQAQAPLKYGTGQSLLTIETGGEVQEFVVDEPLALIHSNLKDNGFFMMLSAIEDDGSRTRLIVNKHKLVMAAEHYETGAES